MKHRGLLASPSPLVTDSCPPYRAGDTIRGTCMRRIAWLTVTLALAALNAAPARAQGNLPLHAWLFGAWTGGLFPPPSTISAQECLAMPVVIFTRDIVMRAVITDQIYAQRLLETARALPDGVEFHFSRSP